MNAAQRAILAELERGPRTRAALKAALVALGFKADMNIHRELEALEHERLIWRPPPARKGRANAPRAWKLVPPGARDAAEVGAGILSAWFLMPHAAFFKETRGAVEETFARHILYWLLVAQAGYSFEVAGMAVGRHRESVQNGCDVIGELYHDEANPDFAALLDRFADDFTHYLERGGAYRRAARNGVAAIIAAAHGSDGAGRGLGA